MAFSLSVSISPSPTPFHPTHTLKITTTIQRRILRHHSRPELALLIATCLIGLLSSQNLGAGGFVMRKPILKMKTKKIKNPSSSNFDIYCSFIPCFLQYICVYNLHLSRANLLHL